MRTWLAGVGALSLAGSVVTAIGLELLFRGLLQLPRVGRPEFEVLLAPGFAIGAAVGVGTGGWRGALPLIGLASVWALMIPFIRSGVDADFYIRQMWGYVGIAVGVAVALIASRRFEWYGLVAAAIYALAIAPDTVVDVSTAVWCPPGDGARCLAIVSAVRVLLSIVGGAAAGVIVGRQLPLRDTIVVAVIIALPSVALISDETQRSALDSYLWLAATARGIIGGITLVLAAWVRRTFTREPDPGELGRFGSRARA